MRWDPAAGHVPRGFAGALGEPGEVELVLVTAEPGNPYRNETYDPAAAPGEILGAACEQVYRAFEQGTDQLQRNIRYLIDGCFPALSFEQQMRRTWLTDSVLCSASAEGARIARPVTRECRSRYLEEQLRLFPRALVVALGSKTRYRLRGSPGVVSAFSVAPPGCNFRCARPSWDRVIAAFRARAKH